MCRIVRSLQLLTLLFIFGPLFSGLLLAESDPSDFFGVLQWRSIGPDRGGRSIAVAGHRDRPHEYYFGATGGGLWKTIDGGMTWRPVTDGQIKSSSVGAVAVAESHPDIVYLGMGETQLRANVLQGDGLYRSADGGRSWTHMGLHETHAISRIRVHPEDANLVYVAALGNPFAPNSQRGVFRTRDGGRTWKKILFRNDRAGAIDLAIDPKNPRTLYATLWEVSRKPWQLWSGGEGSGIFKSTNGGDSWVELTHNPGFPQGLLGKITVTVSGADSQRVWANVEAENGGLYRSDDGGSNWTLTNNHRDLWQRAFYFLRIQADPADRDTLYVLNFNLFKSRDGGRTFSRIPEAHSDHHDLWIDPGNPLRMLNGNDGGAVVSVNGGETWTEMRYPTAQIYRLATTADFPYHACGAQQDNTTVCVSSERGHLLNPRSPSTEWMYSVGGGESGYVAPHPSQPDIFYAGATNTLTRYDRSSGLGIDVQPYPRIVMGEPAQVMPERWNWTYPIAISPVDPKILLVGSQYLWRTADEGKTWEKISPDLTRALAQTLEDSGGPIIKDQDGPEIYATLYSITPSRFDVGTIWTGSDDGLLSLTRDGGMNWSNVTPPGMPEHSRITLIEASPHQPATAYVAAIRYEMNDRTPYLWRTQDYGRSWDKITAGFPEKAFVRVVREDPQRQGLLYAGTEHGVFVSFNDGEDWKDLSLNLPDSPVTGLVVQERDVVIATHGRSFWVLDDIEILRQLDEEPEFPQIHVFKPATAIRRSVPAIIDYSIPRPSESVRLEILDSQGQPVRTLFEGEVAQASVYRRSWDLRYEGAVSFPGIVLEGGDPTRGPWAPPGQYNVRLTVNEHTQMQEFEVKKDPRLNAVSDDDLRRQFDLAIQIRDAESAANQAVILVRRLTEDVRARLSQTSDPMVHKSGDLFIQKSLAVAATLYQLKNQSPKDKIAFPIRLNDRLTGLRSHLEWGDGAPTGAYDQVFQELSTQLSQQLDLLDRLLDEDLRQLNDELERLQLPRIAVDRQ